MACGRAGGANEPHAAVTVPDWGQPVIHPRLAAVTLSRPAVLAAAAKPAVAAALHRDAVLRRRARGSRGARPSM